MFPVGLPCAAARARAACDAAFDASGPRTAHVRPEITAHHMLDAPPAAHSTNVQLELDQERHARLWVSFQG